MGADPWQHRRQTAGLRNAKQVTAGAVAVDHPPLIIGDEDPLAQFFHQGVQLTGQFLRLPEAMYLKGLGGDQIRHLPYEIQIAVLAVQKPGTALAVEGDEADDTGDFPVDADGTAQLRLLGTDSF